MRFSASSKNTTTTTMMIILATCCMCTVLSRCTSAFLVQTNFQTSFQRGAHGGGSRTREGRFAKTSFSAPITFPQQPIRNFNPPHSTTTRLAATTTTAQSASSILSTVLQTIQTFSKSGIDGNTALHALTEMAISTPPIAYFLALIGAGFGLPVSEDALCIFAGATLASTNSQRQRWLLLVALYFGVVLSDGVTFLLGRALRFGVLEPVRKLVGMGYVPDEEERTESELVREKMTNTNRETNDGTLQRKNNKRENQVRSTMDRAGNYVGFVTRFSIGMRGPLMLLSGFTNQVSFMKFMFGAAMGGMGSLTIQLCIGYSMRHNLRAVLGVMASVSTIIIVFPTIIGLVSGIMAVLVKNRKVRRSSTV